MAKTIGYMVVTDRPSLYKEGERSYDSAGTIWPELEPVENHRVYCQGEADRSPERFGDVTYRIVALTVVELCVHCGVEVSQFASGDGWKHNNNMSRCQSPDVAYGHLAHPADVPCRADGPNPCLGATFDAHTI